MRRCLLLFGLLYLIAPAQADAGCNGPRPRGPVRLPDAIWVKGSCGTFALRRDGTVAQVHPPPWAPKWAPGALARADERTYIAHPRRHLVLWRDARVLWRSRLAHGSDNVVVHGGTVAFTAYERRPTPDVWVARLGAPERLAGPGEDLRGWARAGGFFTQRGQALLLRAGDGRLVRHLGRVRWSSYDNETQTLLAITDANLLIRTDGRNATTLADVRALGLARHPWLEVLPGGLIRVSSGNRMLLLRRNGTRFASSSVTGSTRGNLGETIVSSVVPLPAQRGVVFVTKQGRSGTGASTDRVFVLERGRRVASLLYERRGIQAQCGYWANLSVRGNKLLYWPSQGRALILLDTNGRSAPVDLWPTLNRMPGFRHRGFLRRAAWASDWNG